MNVIKRRTPAKVNLCLLVGPRNDSGYHEVFTVYAPVELYDEVEFSLEVTLDASGGGDLTVDCPAAPGESNLVAKALRSLERLVGCAFDGRVVVDKNIPVGAGLGGGSSDGALSLLMGAQLVAEAGGPIVNYEQLRLLARDLGADVPFFLDPRPAIGKGVGDVLEPVTLPVMWLVLAFFERALATERVYRTFDSLGLDRGPQVFEFRSEQAERRWRTLADVSQVARYLENDLEQAAFTLIPSLATDREVIVREGALGALMSGSGPTLFGVCATLDKAEEVADRLRVRGFRTKVTRAGGESVAK